MKNIYKLVVLSILAFATVGCAMHPDEGSDDVASSPLVSGEVSVAEPATADGVASEALVECFRFWTCTTCNLNGNIGNRNILVEECSDGSERVVQQRACGEDCF